MERLIFTNQIPSKLHSRPCVFLPRLGGINVQRLGISPPSATDSRRFNSVFCKFDDGGSSTFAQLPSTSRVVKSAELSLISSLPADSPDAPVDKPPFFKKILEAFSTHQKVVAAGSLILLTALFMMLLHPVFVSPAFATFHSVAKTGGPTAAAAGSKLIRSEFLTSAWTGFLAGCLHTLSGPDHLAALAPLSIGRTKVESALVGALWGCGHDAGQVIFGLLFLLLKDRLHIEIIRTWGTRVVGLTLLIIGGMGIREASEVPAPCVALENGECDDSVYEATGNPTTGKKKIGLATFATGIVHGLQPDALMMVLPALALPSRLAGAAFLGMFLVGTVIAMGSYTVFIGSCSEALKERVPRITEKLTWASSLVAITLGVAIICSQFLGFNLY